MRTVIVGTDENGALRPVRVDEDGRLEMGSNDQARSLASFHSSALPATAPEGSVLAVEKGFVRRSGGDWLGLGGSSRIRTTRRRFGEINTPADLVLDDGGALAVGDIVLTADGAIGTFLRETDDVDEYGNPIGEPTFNWAVVPNWDQPGPLKTIYVHPGTDIDVWLLYTYDLLLLVDASAGSRTLTVPMVGDRRLSVRRVDTNPDHEVIVETATSGLGRRKIVRLGEAMSEAGYSIQVAPGGYVSLQSSWGNGGYDHWYEIGGVSVSVIG